MNYSKAIRTLRASKGFSQKKLAFLTELDASYISRIEKGERTPTLDVIEKISKKLEVPMYLVTLLASEQNDIRGLPEKETKAIANHLLDVLISAKKDK